MKYDADKLKSAVGKYKYLLILVLAGIVLLMWPSSTGQVSTATSASEEPLAFSTYDMEGRLAEALRQMDGVGRVEVVLTLRSGIETIFQTESNKRVSQQQEGGETVDYSNDTSESTLVLAQGGGVQQPAIVMQRSPEFMGALIIADGGDNQVVSLQIVNAVSALTGIPSDRISVAQMAK